MTLWVPSDADLLDLRVPRRVDDFRFDLLDVNYSPIGVLSPNGDSPVRVTNDGTRDIPRTLDNLSLPASELVAINTLTDRLRVTAILQNGSEYTMGTFLWGDDSRPRRAWGLERTSTLVDRMFTVNQQLGGSFGFPPGRTILSILYYLLYGLFRQDEIVAPGLDGITNAGPVAWSGTTTRRQVAGDLANLVGYLPPYIDRDGRFTMRPAPSVGTEPALYFEADQRVIDNSIVESDDSLSAPNRYVVTDATAGNAPITATYDLPPSAPHSIANRGFPIVETITVNGLQSPAAAYAAAAAAAQTDAHAYEWRDFASTFDPRLDTWDVVGFLGDPWLNVSWSAELFSGGIMPLTCRRQYDL